MYKQELLREILSISQPVKDFLESTVGIQDFEELPEYSLNNIYETAVLSLQSELFEIGIQVDPELTLITSKCNVDTLIALRQAFSYQNFVSAKSNIEFETVIRSSLENIKASDIFITGLIEVIHEKFPLNTLWLKLYLDRFKLNNTMEFLVYLEYLIEVDAQIPESLEDTLAIYIQHLVAHEKRVQQAIAHVGIEEKLGTYDSLGQLDIRVLHSWTSSEYIIPKRVVSPLIDRQTGSKACHLEYWELNKHLDFTKRHLQRLAAEYFYYPEELTKADALVKSRTSTELYTCFVEAITLFKELVNG